MRSQDQSLNPRPKNTLWHVALEDGHAVEAWKRARLARFTEHKNALLGLLRKESEDSAKSTPLDEDKWWGRLSRLADAYLYWDENKREGTSAYNRKKRLRTLATTVRKASDMLKEVMRENVGNDLFRAMCAEINFPLHEVVNYASSSVLTDIIDQVPTAVKILNSVEKAAQRAIYDVHKGRGHPEGPTVLPTDFIVALAMVYRRSTGSKLGSGHGPFARFTSLFLGALGRRNIEDDTLVGSIQKARTASLKCPGRWDSSPFED